VIGKVMRGADAAGLLRYLFGPGRHNEHIDPHVVAHWSGLPADAVPHDGAGAPQLAGLIADLRTDLADAGLLGAERSVWHCSVSLPAADGALSDAQWRAAAEQLATAVGFDDRRAGVVRWVAVRHGLSANGNDHIHLVAALAGRTADSEVTDRRHLRRDYAAIRAVCTRLERQWHLTRTGAGSGAAHRLPQRAERHVAARARMPVPQRVRLHGAVRSAAVASRGPAEFAARLAGDGIEAVFTRPSAVRPGTWLGVTFRSPDYTTAAGHPIAFSGRSLASDLTAPALQARWDAANHARIPAGSTGALIANLADQLRAAAVTRDLPMLRGQVRAGADALWAAAEAVEADRGGPWHAAASEAARAAREPGEVNELSTEAHHLRALTAGLGLRPRAQSKADAELARAHAAFQRLLHLWAHLDRGEPARVAAATAARLPALLPPSAPLRTAGARRRHHPAPDLDLLGRATS
jgi:hypothetical protein